jgi:hypothetical protein
VAVSINDRSGRLVGWALVGLAANGEPRVMVTTGDDGDEGPVLAIFPQRETDKAIEAL